MIGGNSDTMNDFQKKVESTKNIKNKTIKKAGRKY